MSPLILATFIALILQRRRLNSERLEPRFQSCTDLQMTLENPLGPRNLGLSEAFHRGVINYFLVVSCAQACLATGLGLFKAWLCFVLFFYGGPQSHAFESSLLCLCSMRETLCGQLGHVLLGTSEVDTPAALLWLLLTVVPQCSLVACGTIQRRQVCKHPS